VHARLLAAECRRAHAHRNCTQPTAPTADDGCESNLGASTQSCGGCGRAGSLANATSVTCVGGLCNQVCSSTARANCSRPVFPTADDGCETNANDPAHCGVGQAACGNICTFPNATATCPAGVCQFGACNSLRQSCDGNSANGCECEGTGCNGAACQNKHSNGVGQFFYDNVTLGTWNLAQAMKACAAYNATPGTCVDYTCGGGNQPHVVCSDGAAGQAATCDCWAYGGSTGDAGKVDDSGNNTCGSPTGTGWPMWN